jgi:hypothetical protein
MRPKLIGKPYTFKRQRYAERGERAMNRHELRTETQYPAAPWRSVGQLWLGIFATDTPAQLPDGLSVAVNPYWRSIALIRYREGTLHYDELIVGPLARRGVYIGTWIEYIWVDSMPSLWGGRRIWGLQKELATFDWDNNRVHVTDATGDIATLTLDQGVSWLPPLPLPGAGIGRLGARWTFILPHVLGRPRLTKMHVTTWSPRFGCNITARPLFAMAASPFHARIDAPKLLP